MPRVWSTKRGYGFRAGSVKGWGKLSMKMEPHMVLISARFVWARKGVSFLPANMCVCYAKGWGKLLKKVHLNQD
jgi:hypothetical protein